MNTTVEPLPDIDFNIRAGNTLVGFATKDEVKEAITITKGKHEQINLLSADDVDTLNRIDENAEVADRAFKKFQEMQTKHGMDSKSFSNAKKVLQGKLKALEDELNTYLAAQYGISFSRHSRENGNPLSAGRPSSGADSLDSCWSSPRTPIRGRNDKYEKWLSSHKPFHWFIDFYGIMKHGGFDVIIGNPPYVEYSKVRDEYTIKNYKTESCGNLYAFVMERSMGIVREKGYFGMIVPISLVCSERMSTIREDILGQCLSTWFSNFAIRPQPLFAEIMQRNTVTIAQAGKNQPCRIFSTNYLRWTAVEREYLFRRFCFADVTSYVTDGEVIPKVSKSVEMGALVNIKNNALTHIVNLKNPPLETLYFHDSGESYWTKTLWDKPHAYRNNRTVEPSHWFDIQIPAKEKTFVYLLLNSNLFYWLWTVFTDCRDMTKGFIESLALPIKHAVDDNELPERLKEAYSENTVLFEKRPGYKSPEIKVRNFKPIIDDIDRVLAKHYGFTDEELDFIINYDIKYRMGRDAGDGG